MNASFAAQEYFVNHGKTATIARFRAPAGTSFSFGDRVIVQSERGLEVGSILSEVSSWFAPLLVPGGVILRRPNTDDLCCAEANEVRGRELLELVQADAASAGLAALILDLEILHDTQTAILHLIPEVGEDLSEWLERLSERHHIRMLAFDLSGARETEPGGCGQPGCGSGNGGCSSCSTGGCSSGSCSAGKVKDAAELTAYFAGLREQMESRRPRLSLHG